MCCTARHLQRLGGQQRSIEYISLGSQPPAQRSWAHDLLSYPLLERDGAGLGSWGASGTVADLARPLHNAQDAPQLPTTGHHWREAGAGNRCRYARSGWNDSTSA